MEAARDKDASSNPFFEFSKFVREHVAVVNAIVVASTTFVGAMDFLGPKLSVLPSVVYSITGVLVTLMIVAAMAPAAMLKLFGLLGLSVRRDDKLSLWRRPMWQFGVAILLMITTLGFVSVARASEGGLIASRFPEAKRWQVSLLSLEADTKEIKSGVVAANSKLDRIVDVVDPDNPADRCPDIECAVQGGASAKAVKNLFGKGARIEGGPANRGELAKWIASSHRADRLQVLDMLIERGLDPAAIIFAFATSLDEVNAEGLRIAREVQRVSGIGDRFAASPAAQGVPELEVWDQIQGCLLRTSKGTSLMELAAIRGDQELYRHLKARGVSLPGRQLVCKWADGGQSGGARIDIGEGVATVASMRP